MIYGNDHSSIRIMRVKNNWKPEERTEFRNTHFSNIFLKNISRNVFLKRVQLYQRDKKRKKNEECSFLH